MKKGSILAIVLAITAMLLTGCEGGNVSKSTDGVVNGTNGTGTATVPTGTSNSTGQTQNTPPTPRAPAGLRKAPPTAPTATRLAAPPPAPPTARRSTPALPERAKGKAGQRAPAGKKAAPRGRVRAGLQPHPLRRETALACSRAAGPGAGYPSCKRWGPDCRTEGLLPGGSRTGPAARRALRPVGGW